MTRPAEPLVLALDVGSSSVRAILHDGTGTPIQGAEAHEPYEPRVAPDGTAEVEPDRLLRLTERAISRALEGRREEVAAVAASTFWHGLVGLRGRRPATPLWLWSDSRSWRQAQELRRRHDGERVRQRTGCPLHPSYWPSKLRWAGARSAERWCSFGDYLYLALLGELGTSLSMASGTGVLGLRDSDWDAEMLDMAGVRREQLPEIRESTTPGAGARAGRWPQLARACWFDAAGDGALANLGSGCDGPEIRAVTIGTSAAIRATTTRLPRRLPKGLWCYRLDRERLIVGGAFSNGGNLHAWVMDNFRVERDALERAVERMAPAAHGLVFLPLLAGERSPGYALRATGALAGLTLATTGADVMRAGMEAIGIRFAAVDEQLDRAVPGARGLVGSGVALLSSPAWMQILADCVGKPLHAGRFAEASSRGAALFALERLGVRVGHGRPGRRTFIPDQDAHVAYQRERRRQERLYRALVADHLVGAAAPAHMRLRGQNR